MKTEHRTTRIAAIAAAIATASAAAAASDVSVRLKGRLGDTLDRMIERHVAATDAEYITAPFMEKTERRNWWQSEFWGKWMHSSTPYLCYMTDGRRNVESAKCKIAEELSSKVERGIDRMLSSQEPCGYIGNYPDELRCGEGWDVWGMKYTLMGLLHYYDWKSKAESEKCKVEADAALKAAQKLCDYIIAEIGPGGRRGRELWQTGNWSGYASSSILEPVVWLYRRIRLRQDFGGQATAKKYLDFATYIVKGMTEPESGPRLIDLALKGVSVADRNGSDYNKDGPWQYVCKNGRSKAYEMMSCYQGLLDYVEVKSEESKAESEELQNLRKAAIMTANDIVKEEINLAGGCACSEAWFHGARKQHLPYRRLQETCVTTTWMRFCEKLLDTTDDPKWADQIERTFYNAYLAAMKADGSEFAGYTPLSGNRWHGQHHCYMHTDCCTANGPRGFLCFLHRLFSVKGDEATIDFYASALAAGTLDDGRKVAFDMYSLYPRTGEARIVSHCETEMTLRLRIPAWCDAAKVSLNGRELGGVQAGTYFRIRRRWALGDIVNVSFAMPVVAHTLDGNAAFTRGPVLLARDSRFADGDLSEPLRRGIANGQKMSGFADVRSPSDDIWMTFSATLPIGQHHENPEGALPSTVFFCDYASAGNTWRRDNYYRTWFPVERNQND